MNRMSSMLAEESASPIEIAPEPWGAVGEAFASADAEAEADETIADAPDPYAEAEPPSAEALGIDTAGLPPQRARLVRYVAWCDRCRQELQELEAARAAYLTAMGVPVVTEERLRTLIESDTSNYLAWIKSRAPALTKTQARSFEREQLEQKLAGDRHAAEVARGAIAQLEAEIDQKREQLPNLEERHRAFVLDAVLEQADQLGAVYRRQADEMRETIISLLGLGVVARGRNGYRHHLAPSDVEVLLPEFGLPSLPKIPGKRFGIRIAEHAAKAAASPWQDLVRRWTDDPRADAGFDPGRPSDHNAPAEERD